MSFFDRLGLTAAETAAQTVGPRAGLRAYRSVVDRLAGRDRARAIVGGLDCATRLGDGRALDEFIARWRVQSGDDYFRSVAQRCLALGAVSPSHAERLAEAEVARRPEDARARYLLGRLRGSDGRTELLRARRLAERSPRQPELSAAITQRLAWLGEAPEGFDRGDLAERARLGKARADLKRSRRYDRAAALDALTELAGGALGPQALALAAAHAERPAPSAIEQDRLRTLFGGALGEPERARAMAWLDAREALDRGEMPPAGEARERARPAREALEGRAPAGADPVSLALGVVAHRGEPDAQREALRRLVAHPELADVTEPLLAAAALAHGVDDELAGPLTARLLELPDRANRGWLRLAQATRGPHRVAALARAKALGEPRAERAAALEDRAAAWKALEEGDAEEAARRIGGARKALRR